MVGIRFTYYAKKISILQNKVHLFIKEMEPTWDGTPRGERLAMRDATDVIRQIVDSNCNSDEHKNIEERLVQPGEPDASYFPVFMFCIGVTWNRDKRAPHYSRVCHQRYEWDAKWNPIAQLGMEQFDYTMGCLKKYERKIIDAHAPSVSK